MRARPACTTMPPCDPPACRPPVMVISSSSGERNDSRPLACSTGGTGRSQCTVTSCPSIPPDSDVTCASERSSGALRCNSTRPLRAMPAVTFWVSQGRVPGPPMPAGHKAERSAKSA